MVQFCFARSYLGIETVSFHLLLRMARMNMDWNLKKLSQLRLCSHKSGFFLKPHTFLNESFLRPHETSESGHRTWNHSPDGFNAPSTRLKKSMGLRRCWIQGRGPGGTVPLIFRPNWGPEGGKIFLRPPPLSQGLDDRASPPPPLSDWGSGSDRAEY